MSSDLSYLESSLTQSLSLVHSSFDSLSSSSHIKGVQRILYMDLADISTKLPIDSIYACNHALTRSVIPSPVQQTRTEIGPALSGPKTTRHGNLFNNDVSDPDKRSAQASLVFAKQLNPPPLKKVLDFMSTASDTAINLQHNVFLISAFSSAFISRPSFGPSSAFFVHPAIVTHPQPWGSSSLLKHSATRESSNFLYFFSISSSSSSFPYSSAPASPPNIIITTVNICFKYPPSSTPPTHSQKTVKKFQRESLAAVNACRFRSNKRKLKMVEENDGDARGDQDSHDEDDHGNDQLFAENDTDSSSECLNISSFFIDSSSFSSSSCFLPTSAHSPYALARKRLKVPDYRKALKIVLNARYPDTKICNIVLAILADSDKSMLAEALWVAMTKANIPKDIFTYTIMIDIYGRQTSADPRLRRAQRFATSDLSSKKQNEGNNDIVQSVFPQYSLNNQQQQHCSLPSPSPTPYKPGWYKAWKLFEEFKDQNVLLVDVALVNAMLGAYANAAKVDDTWGLFHHVFDNDDCAVVFKLQPNITSYLILIKAATKAKKFSAALTALAQMKYKGIKPDIRIYTAVIQTCAKCKQHDRAIKIFHEIEKVGLEPNLYTYSVCISSCASVGDLQTALGLLHEMKQRNLQLNAVIYNGVISACKKSADVDTAFDLLRLMTESNINPNVVTFTTLITVCTQKRNLTRAKQAFEEMKERGIAPNKFTYTTMLQVAGNNGDVFLCRDLIQEMRDANLFVDNFNYNMALKACAKSDRWQPAVEIWDDMVQHGVTPDVTTYNYGLLLFAKGNQFQRVSSMISEMRQRGLLKTDI